MPRLSASSVQPFWRRQASLRPGFRTLAIAPSGRLCSSALRSWGGLGLRDYDSNATDRLIQVSISTVIGWGARLRDLFGLCVADACR